jgi:LuxR family transcriptional regulator of csgAB operon
MKVLADDLSNREKEVLVKICKGKSNIKIADDLSISPNTVKKHVHNTFRKLDVNNRFQAVLWTMENFT